MQVEISVAAARLSKQTYCGNVSLMTFAVYAEATLGLFCDVPTNGQPLSAPLTEITAVPSVKGPLRQWAPRADLSRSARVCKRRPTQISKICNHDTGDAKSELH